MPNTFWSIRRREERRREDVAPLRRAYLEDGRKAAETIARDDRVLAVWLAGPFEMPRVAPGNDLHLGVLVRGSDHVSYRHVLPAMSETGRRLEIACFPADGFEANLSQGLASWARVYDAHKLRDMEALFDRDGTLGRMRERARALRPTPLFVGRLAAGLAAELREAEVSIAAVDFGEGVLASRRLLSGALALFLLCRGVTFSKPGELLPGLKSRASLVKVDDYERAQRVNGIALAEARRTTDRTRELVKGIFERMTR